MCELSRDASKILYQMYQDALEEIKCMKFSDFPIGMNEKILKEEYNKNLKKFKCLLMNLDDMC